MQKTTKNALAEPEVRGLRSDLDLGLRMVESLVRIGEVGSAVRLTEELRVVAADALDPRRAQRTGPRRSRRAIAGAAMAAAIGIGGLAAAGVAPAVFEEPAVRPPATKVRPGSDGSPVVITPDGIVPAKPGNARTLPEARVTTDAVSPAPPAAADVLPPADEPAPDIIPSPELPDLPPPPDPGDLSEVPNTGN